MPTIRRRIVVPFAVLFLAALLAVAFLAARVTARNVEARIQARMAETAKVLSQSTSAGSNPTVLAKIKSIVGGELATVDGEGAVLATTLDAKTHPQARAELQTLLAGAAPRVGEGAAPTRRLVLGGRRYRATFAPVRLAPGRARRTFLCLLVPESEFREAAWQAVQPILLAAACGAVAVVAIGYVVAHRIARPIEALATRMRGLAGHAQAPPARARDEVAELSAAIQALLESLHRAEARLVGSERLAAVGQVAAAVGHELRNPLSGIKMSAQLLGKKLADLGSPDDESVRVLLAEVARLEVIIDDLLTFAGPARLSCEPGDLHDVVREVLYFMNRQLTHASILVEDRLAPELPPVAHDPRRIRQVVLNLVLNATEAMPGGGTLTVESRAAGDSVTVAVEDTGRGVAAEDAEKIFDPFFTTKKGGSGLGLAVSRLIVEAHGGALRFEPTSIGARFAFSLPRDGGRPDDAKAEGTDASA